MAKVKWQFKELNNTQLETIAPSIFQTKPYKEATDRYSFIPTIQAVDWLRDAGWKPVQARQSGVRDLSRDGYQKHMIRFTRPDLIEGTRRSDIVLYNSHDVSSTFKLLGGFYRLVCSNGLVVGDDICQFVHRHVDFSIEEFIENAKKIDKTLVSQGKKIDDWKIVELSDQDRIAFAGATVELLHPNGCTYEPDALLSVRRKEDENNSLWHTMNIIQENFMRGGINGKSSNNRTTTTREITSIEREKEVNQTLWQIADNMYDLKAA